MRDIVAAVKEETVIRMEKLVKDGIAAGEFRLVDSRIIASLLLGMTILPPLQTALQQK